MAALPRDLRYALRTLRKAPGFTAVAALTLGLGIGANAAMLGLLDALLVRPPAQVREPERVVGFRVERTALRGSQFEMSSALSYPQFASLRDGARGFSGVAAFTPAPVAVGEGEAVRNEPVILASGEYFPLLGVRPALGRTIEPEDDRVGAANPVAVLSWDYWRRAYGGDPGILGEPITVGGRRLTVVGVAPKRFVGSELDSPSLWVPLSLAPQLGYEPEMITSPFVSWLSVFGRLAPGATEEQARATAQAALLAAHEAAATAPPPGRRGGRAPGSARIEMRAGPPGEGAAGRPEAPPPPRVQLARIGGIGRAGEGPGGGAPVQTWYLAVTAAVLLIACANVANLLLARGAYRSHELAVRLSMGATPGRLARQLLTESAVLALLGGIAGSAVALGVWRLLPAVIDMPPLPPLLDLRALANVAALTLATVVLFGLVPVAGLRRSDIRAVLGSAAPSIARRSRGRSALVVAQFAVCVVLLIGAGLFVRSFQEVRTLDLGYDRDRVLVVTADTRGAGWTPERVEAYWAAARQRLEALPGVARVEAAVTVPYLMRLAMPIAAAPGDAAEEAGEEPVMVDFVGPAYFETLGISIEEGRAFGAGDREGTAPVAIVSRSFARRRLASPSPVGRCLAMPGGGGCIEVVGVAEDARFGELTDESPEFVYRPLEQMAPMLPPPAVLHVRAAGDPRELVAALRAEMRAVDPSVTQAEVRPLTELIAPQLTPWRASAVLLAVFGGIGLLLAAVGLYGVIAFLVARRTREIGIRVALGAARGSILRLVVGDAARMVGAGAVLGLLLAAAAARVVGSMLYGVGLLDPAVYLATAGLLVAVSLLAALAPARRALKVDPMEALRTD